MHPQTEQLLGTLEVLYPNTFVWENTAQEEFSLWNLMISEGFVSLTDVEVAFEHWQNIEEWGTPTKCYEYSYAPRRSERKNDNWDETIAKERKSYYQQLLQMTTSYLQNIQTYNLSVPKIRHKNFEWDHPNFSVSIIVAQTPENYWICLAPTVPDQVSSYQHDRRVGSKKQTIFYDLDSPNITSEIITAKIQPILALITPISIYGYYDGGYNYTYQHHIIGALAETKTNAIAVALQKAEMVVIEKMTDEYANYNYNSCKLNQFMNTCLRDCTRYNLSFWDVGYTYSVGQTEISDWIGTRYQSEFEYNP